MGKVSKNKMVLKQCPICDHQVPVACKLCRCGHGFFNKRLMQPKESADEDTNGVKRRRTERVRRERPDYYSASEFENHLRRISTSSKSGDKEEEKVSKQKKQRRGRPKGSQTKNKDGASADQKEKEREEDLYANIPTDKAFQYAVVLAEINEKMQNQTWKQPVCQEGPTSSPEGNAVVTT